MLPLRWFYTLVNAHLCVLKLQASTYIHEPHSIVSAPGVRRVISIIPKCFACLSNHLVWAYCIRPF